jgi:predicted transcriptional regulator
MALKNRSRVEILYDIVASAKTAAKKTHLMYKSNLSFKQLDLYLEYILQNGLLEERFDDDNGGKVYALTNRGIEFLNLFEHLQSFFPVSKSVVSKAEAQERALSEPPNAAAGIPLAKPAFAY